MPALVTRVFMNGNSQAVRIPQELRLDATQVEIRRNEAGELIIRALPSDRGAALLQALQGFDAQYADLLEQDRQDQNAPQEREAL
ncbi:MAG: AbrB/MazE/SpoVT family DNA-binding domain-containing protein [Aquabacterium sp.]|nr:AbrB/MazE/SpoVT family DNA-binding domain-containing protein [Aquabacterium sp.]